MIPLYKNLSLVKVTCTSLLLLLSTTASIANQKKPPTTKVQVQAPLIVRVGAIYYDDSDIQYTKMEELFSSIEESQKTPDRSKREIKFKLAVGTYDEVLNWYQTDQIDLAVMNPAPFAMLLNNYKVERLKDLFVGIRKITPPETSVAWKKGIGARGKYNSVMLLNKRAIRELLPAIWKDEKVTEEEERQIIEFVIAQTKAHSTRLLLVHPLSTSGYIFPRHLLVDNQVELKPSDFELTYSHDASTNQILESGFDKQHRLFVGFVSDESKDTSSPELLAIRSGMMRQEIIQDALVFTPEFAQSEPTEINRVRELLKTNKAGLDFSLESPEQWWRGYDEVKKWINSFDRTNSLAVNSLSIEQIIRRITNYNRHHKKDPARVALVLSGGGAKCAYQIGAVEVLEDRFEAAQKESALGPKIDLVVGTSGGAINALTVAAEITRESSSKRKELRQIWEGFGQSEILKPYNLVRRMLGWWAGTIIAFTILFVLHPYLLRWPRFLRRWKEEQFGADGEITRPFKRNWVLVASGLQLGLALILYLLGIRQLLITNYWDVDELLRYHNLIHVLEYSRQCLRWAAFALAVCGSWPFIQAFINFLTSKVRPRPFTLKWSRLVLVLITVSIVLVPLAIAYYSIAIADSLFVSDGIEQKMAVEIPKLLGIKVSHEPSLSSLEQTSQGIIEQGVIKRDLIITGSVLSSFSGIPAQSVNDDQIVKKSDDTDLYFYYQAGSSTDLPETVKKDNRFVSLRDPANKTILLDAVIGSGSIFPAFEPRPISTLKRVQDQSAMKDVEIIDGGFVHNSPIEAAVRLKATHIIVIEASPEDQSISNQNLFNNSLSAFSHLFEQAQLLDARSRRQAEIFTLRPAIPQRDQTPFLCTLDFGQKYIFHALNLGKMDASNGEPRFKREPRPSGL